MKASKTSRIFESCGAALLFMLLSGCVGGQPIKYYRLEIPPAPDATPEIPFGVSLQVANLDTPPLMRDGRLLYQVGTHEVGAYEYHRWVETPDRIVQSSLVRMLRGSGKFQSVDTPRSGAKADYVLQGRIYEFSEVDRPEIFSNVSLEVELHEVKTLRTVWSRTYTHEERVDGKQVPDVVASLDKNLQQGLREIVNGLNQYFSTKVATAKPLP
jgi:ABC-type uncharacterized transport system auxiliary subunit